MSVRLPGGSSRGGWSRRLCRRGLAGTGLTPDRTRSHGLGRRNGRCGCRGRSCRGGEVEARGEGLLGSCGDAGGRLGLSSRKPRSSGSRLGKQGKAKTRGLRR